MSSHQNLKHLRAVIEKYDLPLQAISEEQASQCPVGSEWSRKEILGHLIVSAAINHHRFMQALLKEPETRVRYNGDDWNEFNFWPAYDWADLVNFWRIYYQHLLHLLERIPETAMTLKCPVDWSAYFDDPDVNTVQWHIGHIARHVEGHMQAIVG